jgi:ABC-2 type transport system permease protein
MTRVLLYILLGIIIIFYFVLLAISNITLPDMGPHAGNIQNLLGLPVAMPFGMMILSFVGCILATILSASTIGNEYNWRTIRTVVVSSESRFKLLTAKLISATIFILIGMVIGLVVGFIMSLITTAIGGYAFDFSFATSSYMWDQFFQFWRTFFVMIPYILLGFMFAVVGRSAMPGIAAGIGIFFIEAIMLDGLFYLAGGWLAKVPNYLLYANLQTITNLADLPQGFREGMGAGSLGIKLPTSTHAFITLAIYSIVFLFISFYLFRKRDVTG